MTTIEVTYKNKTLIRSIPSEWQEIKRSHLFAFVYAILQRDFTREQILRSILYKWLNLPADVFFNIPIATITELCSHLDFLFQTDIQTPHLIIPFYDYNFKRWYGPGDDFSFLTVNEFAVAENCLIDFSEDQNDVHLKKLFVTLYRRPNHYTWLDYKESGKDPRPELSDPLIAKHIASLKNISPYFLRAIWYNFIAFHNHVVQSNKSLFSSKSASSGLGWAAVIHSLAGPELGNINQVGKMPFNDCLLIMRKLDFDRQQFEKQLANA